MANPQKGEVEFESGGQKLTLVYTYNALCSLEDQLGLGINEITALLGDKKKIRLTTVRAMLWAGLQELHPEIDIKRAGEMINDQAAGKAVEAFGKGMALAFPGEAKGKETNPPQPGAEQSPQPGIGKSS